MENELKKLKVAILNGGIVRESEQQIINTLGTSAKWIFDLRPFLMNSDTVSIISKIFWDRFSNKYPFQIGCQEIAAIPLLGAIIERGAQIGKPLTGFIVRKSRKKTGLQKIIEGEVNSQPIILIDDIINSGNTAERQIDALGDKKHQIFAFFTVVKFHDNNFYKFFEQNRIELLSLFTLKDFNLEIEPLLPRLNHDLFEVVWKFEGENPNFFYVTPKSAPIIDSTRVFFGNDSGYFFALNQKDGSILWKFKTGETKSGKRIFSTAILHAGFLYFGSYDGNLYTLSAEEGSLKWCFDEADWIGSSPAIAPELNLLFIGLEFGLFRKRGGIAAIDLKTGEKVWESKFSTEYIHASPAYDSKRRQVGIGSNDKVFRMFDAKNGRLLWNYKTTGEIKASSIFDPKRDLVIFGAYDGAIYALSASNGSLQGKFQTENCIYSTPLIVGDFLFVTSGDKNIYCFNLETGSEVWHFTTSGRIMSNPKIIQNKLYVGSNDGRLYEIDSKTGKGIGFFQALERITNTVVYNQETARFFLETCDGTLYCLKRR